MQSQSTKNKSAAYKWGGEEVDLDSGEAIAKVTVDPISKITSYWIKRATAGGEAGCFFNPMSPNFNEFTVNRIHSELGRGAYEFRRATQESFDHYLQFIKTGDVFYYRHAERSK